MANKKNLKNLFKYAGKYKYLTISSWILAAISALLALVPFVYIWFIIRDVIYVMPNFSQATNLTHYGWMAVVFALLNILVYFGALICSHISAFRIARNMRTKSMRHISLLSVGFMSNIGSGKIRRIVDDSSAATETYLAHQLPDMSVALATPLGMLVLLFLFDWRLGLISLIPIVIAFILIKVMMGNELAQKMNEYYNALEEMNNEAVEYVRGVPVVKTFGQTVFSFKRFKNSIDKYKKWILAYAKQLRCPVTLYTTIINSVFALLVSAGLIYAGYGVSDPKFILNLIFYIIFTPVISTTMMKIIYLSENGLIVDDAIKRLDSIFEMKPLPDAKNPKLPKDNSIELKNVSFRYENSPKDAIHNVSIKVRPNKTIALVGPSGGGKTTIAGLISRFWDVNSGEIVIGDVNVKNIDKKDLMNIISYVFQDSKLLKTSILENVRLSNTNASRDDVITALHLAQCDDIIEKLPDGIDTVIGTKGTYLSGGEMQRITIARAFLKNSPIVILDEATAFADPENEYKFQLAFENLAKNKTVIVIAHRLSTIKNVDCIYVLDEGEVVEFGSHEKLLENNKIYKQMWQNYQTSVSWKVAKEV